MYNKMEKKKTTKLNPKIILVNIIHLELLNLT